MGLRLDLQEILEDITSNVYFQPPTNIKIQYPCIVYRRNDAIVKHAGNIKYQNITRYEVTVIDRNPDSEILDSVKELPLCDFDRHFTADNLNHDVYNLFY